MDPCCFAYTSSLLKPHSSCKVVKTPEHSSRAAVRYHLTRKVTGKGRHRNNLLILPPNQIIAQSAWNKQEKQSEVK